MPAIRKIRIVNFRFNNGAKLIPDEIFCTENAEGKPIDTLFNLDNGGGKSVIVQLLLQPICPKAKVQNRNISDFFQKGTDWFCQYHLTHFIRTRIMQRERYDHSRAFFELPEAAHRWRCRFFC